MFWKEIPWKTVQWKPYQDFVHVYKIFEFINII